MLMGGTRQSLACIFNAPVFPPVFVYVSCPLQPPKSLSLSLSVSLTLGHPNTPRPPPHPPPPLSVPVLASLSEVRKVSVKGGGWGWGWGEVQSERVGGGGERKPPSQPDCRYMVSPLHPVPPANHPTNPTRDTGSGSISPSTRRFEDRGREDGGGR